ncbi:MAG: hypothetical protein LAP87_15930 [Acidobacteriia bacterium]|nr:hypothetical protein [Terriglobia bacterium]
MSPIGSSTEPTQPSTARQPSDAQRQEWILRGAAGLAIVLLFWFAYQNQYNGSALLVLAPLIAGAFVTALRLSEVSGAVDSVENWLKAGSARAASRQGKFARFFQRPFFGASLAIWHWTAPIRDAHLRAGVRVTAFIFVSGIAVTLLVMAVYIIVAIVVLMLTIAIIGWALSLSGNSGSSGRVVRVTRYSSDWLGRPKQEHFDNTGEKVGESKPDTDWLGRPKMVHTDAQGNKTGESKPDRDWLGNPKTVHTDAAGNKNGESKPDTDWLGGPKTVHTDAEGNVIGESREETDLLGRPKTVHYGK